MGCLWSLVIENPHIPARAEDRQFRNNDIDNVTKNRNISIHKDGNHGCIVQSDEDGRDKKLGNDVNQQGDLALPLVLENCYCHQRNTSHKL